MPTVNLTAFDSATAVALLGTWSAAEPAFSASPNGDSGTRNTPSDGAVFGVAGLLTDDGVTVPLDAIIQTVSVTYDWTIEATDTLAFTLDADAFAPVTAPGASGSASKLIAEPADLFPRAWLFLGMGWQLDCTGAGTGLGVGRVEISAFTVAVTYTLPRPGPEITLNTLDARTRRGVTIHDVLNDAPNTCTLTVESGTDSPLGQAIRIRTPPVSDVLLFTGTIQTAALTYDGKDHLLRWDCQATDDIPRFNKRIPFGSWTEVSASIIGRELLAFAPGFTGLHIQDNLPAVSLSCTGSTSLSGAFAELATLIGGAFRIEDSDVFLYTSGVPTAIAEITDTWIGDGVMTVFTLTSAVLTHRGYVTVDDGGVINETLSVGGGGMWELDVGLGTITRYAPPGNLADISMIYGTTAAGPDPEDAPDDIDDTPGRFLHDPPITMTLDLSQIRTRVYVQGAGPDSGGLEDALINKPTLIAVGFSAEVGGAILSGTIVWYGISFVTAAGETIPRNTGSAGTLVTSPDGSMELTNLDSTIHTDPRVTGRKLWRAQNDAPTLKLVTTFGNAPGIDDTYLDTAATSTLTTPAPAIDTTGWVFVQVDDAAAQTALATLEGGGSDGIVEYFLSDTTLLTNAAATARGEAELALFAYPLVTVTYACRDVKARSGKTVHIDVTTPPIGPIDLLIQDVTISNLDLSGGPIFQVTASSVRFSLEAILRMALDA